MGKKEAFKLKLRPLFKEYLENKDDRRVTEFLKSNSNLPGRRANLELAKAFVEIIEELLNVEIIEELRDFILGLVSITANQAPVNDPKEFLPFCGTWALGTLGSIRENDALPSLVLLKKMASDPRWRIREAVAKGLGELARTRTRDVMEELPKWITEDQWLIMRSVAAGVAESSMISDKSFAEQALILHEKIFDQIQQYDDRDEDFKVLKKGLGYTLSVVVASIPEKGFKYLQQLATLQDKDIRWIIRENLKKKRLSKSYQNEIKLVERILR